MTTASSAEMLCARIAEKLAQNVGQWRYNMWFDRSARMRYNDENRRLDIAVPNHFVADWIGKHFTDALHDAANTAIGETVALDVKIDPDLFEGDAATTATGSATSQPDRLPTPQPTPPRFVRQAAVGHRVTTPAALRHRLEDFIVGGGNELAYAAAANLGDDDSAPSHTLFIHGGCGLGKTHLLQGICRRVLERNPDAAVLYLTGEQFTNEFLTAVRTNKIDPFRRRIRRLELLAIDDVDFIANKQATQQEFLHSFDALDLKGSRVALASDSHPRLIKRFSESLVSRCVRGMVVEIRTPDAGTRARIIRAMAARRAVSLTDQAVDLLAARCLGSVRDIEGALAKLHALSHLSRRDGSRAVGPVTPAMVQRLFDAEAVERPRRIIHFDTVLDVVCQTLQIRRDAVLGASRHRDVVLARSLVTYLARHMTSMSYPEIGAAMSRRGHSTIITANQRIERQIEDNHVVPMPGRGELVPLAELVERLKQAVLRG